MAAQFEKGSKLEQIGARLRKAEKLGNSPVILDLGRRDLYSVFKEPSRPRRLIAHVGSSK